MKPNLVQANVLKRTFLFVVVLALVTFIAGCGLFNPPPPVPTVLPPIPTQIQTEVAETLTAVAPTAQGGGTPVPPPTTIGGGTPIPPPTQVALATATQLPTLIPGVPTPTPGGEGNPPSVQLLVPVNGAQIAAGQQINVVALASDDAGIARVEFYADNVLQNSQTPSNPTTYQAVFPWGSTQVGPHNLVVIAYDLSNNASIPAAAGVTVVANTTAPQVSILSPGSPQNIGLGAQLNVQVAATDVAGVTQLQMLVDNQPYNQVNSQNPRGQSPFAATFIYAAGSPGTHTIVIRALNSSGNVGNSNPLTVNVTDNNPPAVTVNYSRLNVRQNEQVVVYTNATDAAGIQRVELWADGGLYNVYNVPNPSSQTSIATQQIWASNVPGNHTLFVRVFDVNNQSTSSPATNIFVRQPDQPTPTFTPYVPPPTPYPTRTAQPVTPPPNCQIETPGTNFREELPNPIHIRWTCNATGGVAQMQVFYQYSGVMATQVDQVPGNGGQQQSGEYDWFPPSPGVVSVFVVVFDQLNQRGESPHIPGVVEHERPPTIVPPPPTEVPPPTFAPPPTEPPPPTREPDRPDISGRWEGQVDNGSFIINLEPRIGCSETQCAYGGTFDDTRDNVHGELNGQYDGTNLTLSVEGAQPGDVTWNFEGQVTAGGSQIAGNWSEARAGVPSLQRGSVTFQR